MVWFGWVCFGNGLEMVGLVWFDLEMIWFGLEMVWFGKEMVWFGLVWFGLEMVWFGLGYFHWFLLSSRLTRI